MSHTLGKGYDVIETGIWGLGIFLMPRTLVFASSFLHSLASIWPVGRIRDWRRLLKWGDEFFPIISMLTQIRSLSCEEM
jgi:hypothetical protein